MKDIYRCLDSHPEALLQAIARSWRLSLRGERKREMVEELAEGMLQGGAIGEILENLSPAAKEVLTEAVRQGGTLPTSRLAVAYGDVRPLGPARINRERPGENPQGALEELFYRGLIYRDFEQVEGRHVKVFVVPEQLMALSSISALGAEIPIEPLSANLPVLEEPQGYASVEDCLAALVGIRRFPLEESEGVLRAEADWIGQVVSSERAIGPWHPGRRAFLARLLLQMGVVEGDPIQLTLRARTWLRTSHFRCLQNALVAWRDDSGSDELLALPGIVCEDVGPARERVVARRRLLRLLTELEPDTWYLQEDFVRFVKRRRANYLRPDGDMAQWQVRDSESGEYLTGSNAWDRIEGALIIYLLRGPLYWLGIVDLGSADGEGSFAFRLSRLGERLLVSSAEGVPLPLKHRPEPERPMAIIDGQMVAISTLNTLYERYQLERFARWQGQEERARYGLTAQSLWEAQRAGIRVDQVVSFLERLVASELPEGLLSQLREWGAAYGRARAERCILLQTDDAETMTRIQQDEHAGKLIGKPLGGRSCLVREVDAQALERRLEEIGIWLQFSS